MLLERYSRQVIWPQIGEKGQRKLLSSRVLVVGLGALGSSMASMLARAGVGYLRLVDRDIVEFSNLQRQALFNEQDAKNEIPKVEAAKEKLSRINSEIKIDSHLSDVNFMNIEGFVDSIDCIVDGTDNFETRFLINDMCVKKNISWVYGACIGSYGLAMTVVPRKTACLRCFIEQIPPPGSLPTCDTTGIINPIVNMIASIQVAMAMKLLVSNDWSSVLQVVDIWSNDYKTMTIKKNTECLCCSKSQFDFLKEGSLTSVLCGENAVQILPSSSHPVNLRDIAVRVNGKANDHFLKFTIDNFHVMVFSDGRAIIRGTTDEKAAKSIYSKYIGL